MRRMTGEWAQVDERPASPTARRAADAAVTIVIYVSIFFLGLMAFSVVIHQVDPPSARDAESRR